MRRILMALAGYAFYKWWNRDDAQAAPPRPQPKPAPARARPGAKRR